MSVELTRPVPDDSRHLSEGVGCRLHSKPAPLHANFDSRRTVPRRAHGHEDSPNGRPGIGLPGEVGAPWYLSFVIPRLGGIVPCLLIEATVVMRVSEVYAAERIAIVQCVKMTLRRIAQLT